MTITLHNWTRLCGQTEGHLLAVGLTKDHVNLGHKCTSESWIYFPIYLFIYLINCVFAIFKFGNIEALLLLDVLADNLSDLDGLGDARLDGFRGSDINCDGQWNVDQGDAVLLSLQEMANDVTIGAKVQQGFDPTQAST